MIFEGLSQLIGGFVANKQHKKYADLLMQQNMTMPSGITDAEGIMKGNAGEGLQGYESYMNDIQSLLPNTVNAAKEVVDNPSQLLELVSKAQSTAGSKIRDLGIADADAKLRNEVAYANFLSSVKAPAEQAIENFNIQKTLGAEQERMVGKAEMWKGIGSLGNSIDSLGMAAASAGGGNILEGFKTMFGGGGGGVAPKTGFNSGNIYDYMLMQNRLPNWNNPFTQESIG